MAITTTYLSGGRIQGRSDDSLASAEVVYTTDCFDNNDDDRNSDEIATRSGNNRHWGGVKVVSGGALDGKYCRKIRVKLHVIGACTGNHVGQIRSGVTSGSPGSQGTNRLTSTNTIDLSTIQDSTTFIEFTFDGSYAFGTNSDECVLIYWAQDQSNAQLSPIISIALRWSSETANTADVISTTNDGAPGETDFEFSTGSNTNMSITYDEGTTDEKTTVTDVPVGSEFEQTDDYKTYQRSAEVSVWSQILSSSYSQVNNTNTSEDTRMGQQFESGHANIGKTFDTVTIRLRNRYSSGLTYEIPMKVWLNGSTSSSHTSETTVTLDELQTGTTWDASAPYDDAVTYTFATPITIGTNDIIGIQPSGGTTDSSSVIIREKNLAEADTKMISYRSGAWGIIFDSEDLYMTISLSPSWVERGTAI